MIPPFALEIKGPRHQHPCYRDSRTASDRHDGKDDWRSNMLNGGGDGFETEGERFSRMPPY